MATIATPAAQAGPAGAASHLKANTLNLFDTTVIATSSVAPAYTIAQTSFLLVAAVGVGLASPAAILISFFPVLFIAVAYFYLNSKDPNCGASYSWISRTLNPYVGWISGWIQIVANVFFCATAPVFAGVTTLFLLNSVWPAQISSTAASDPKLIALIGLAWLALVTFMVVRGIRITANFQWLLVGIEYLAVLAFAVAALVKVTTTHPAGSIAASGSWFNPTSIQGITGLAAGTVLGVFFFWGWDTAANVNEESKNASRSPGQAGVLSMFILLLIFLLASTAMQSYLGEKTINDQGANSLVYMAQQIAPTPLWYVMVIAILSSTVAVVQTTLLPQSRLSFSMARDRVFPAVFAVMHRRWLTPWIGTLIAAFLSAIGVALTMLNSGSITSVFTNLISDIGVLVAVYYGLTGIACAWAFRKALLKRPTTLLFAGVLPFLSALFLFWVAFEVIIPAPATWTIGSVTLWAGQGVDWATALPDLIGLGLAIPFVIVAALANRTGFFRQKTVAYTDVTPQRSAV